MKASRNHGLGLTSHLWGLGRSSPWIRRGFALSPSVAAVQEPEPNPNPRRIATTHLFFDFILSSFSLFSLLSSLSRVDVKLLLFLIQIWFLSHLFVSYSYSHATYLQYSCGSSIFVGWYVNFGLLYCTSVLIRFPSCWNWSQSIFIVHLMYV